MSQTKVLATVTVLRIQWFLFHLKKKNLLTKKDFTSKEEMSWTNEYARYALSNINNHFVIVKTFRP